MLRVISFQRGETREVPDEQTLQTPQSVDLLGGVVDLKSGCLEYEFQTFPFGGLKRPIF